MFLTILITWAAIGVSGTLGLNYAYGRFPNNKFIKNCCEFDVKVCKHNQYMSDEHYAGTWLEPEEVKDTSKCYAGKFNFWATVLHPFITLYFAAVAFPLFYCVLKPANYLLIQPAWYLCKLTASVPTRIRTYGMRKAIEAAYPKALDEGKASYREVKLLSSNCSSGKTLNAKGSK